MDAAVKQSVVVIPVENTTNDLSWRHEINEEEYADNSLFVNGYFSLNVNREGTQNIHYRFRRVCFSIIPHNALI